MQNKAKIGVLFCGGCNCYYDRETFYKKIQKELSDECEFLYYKENEHYNTCNDGKRVPVGMPY